MNRIVLVGMSTPIIKVLERLEDYAEGLELVVLFSDAAPGGQVARSAQRLGLELRSIDQLRRDDGVATLRTDAPDWLLNVNSTFIFGSELLAVPMRGCLNMHPGKLPEYAGLHTHQWAIRNGDSRFAATLHWMESEVDAGPIAYERKFDIAPDDTGLSLFMRCLNAGVEVVLEAVRDIAAGRTPPSHPTGSFPPTRLPAWRCARRKNRLGAAGATHRRLCPRRRLPPIPVALVLADHASRRCRLHRSEARGNAGRGPQRPGNRPRCEGRRRRGRGGGRNQCRHEGGRASRRRRQAREAQGCPDCREAPAGRGQPAYVRAFR